METLIIDSNSEQAKSFLNFAKTLSFVKIVSVQAEQHSTSIHKAVAACNATTVDVFFDELDNRIKKRFDNV